MGILNDNGDVIWQISDNMGIDSNGDFHMRVGDYTSMNMSTGELHINSGWKNEDTQN